VEGNIDSSYNFTVKVDGEANYVDLWISRSDTLDFRDSVWTCIPGVNWDGDYVFPLRKESFQSKFIAVFGEATFIQRSRVFTLSTKISVLKQQNLQIKRENK